MHHDTVETSIKRRFENEATVCADDLLEIRSPLGPRAAFLATHQRLTMLAEIGDPTSLLVAAVDPEARVVAGLLVRDCGALVIGRHTQCGLRLLDESVALRHVALLFRRERERPIIRLWDLNTGAPFMTEDGHATGAITADGPVYVRIGPYALWLVPGALAASFPANAALAWSALPPRRIVDRCSAAAPPPRASLRAPDLDLRDEITFVTLDEPPLLLGDGVDRAVEWGMLHFVIGGRHEQRRVSAERLARGILVGRYARCAFTTESDRISRVHLLLVRIDGDLWAIDTASTHGVRRGRVKFEAEVLRDIDAFALTRELVIGWERTKHPDA